MTMQELDRLRDLSQWARFECYSARARGSHLALVREAQWRERQEAAAAAVAEWIAQGCREPGHAGLHEAAPPPTHTRDPISGACDRCGGDATSPDPCDPGGFPVVAEAAFSRRVVPVALGILLALATSACASPRAGMLRLGALPADEQARYLRCSRFVVPLRCGPPTGSLSSELCAADLQGEFAAEGSTEAQRLAWLLGNGCPPSVAQPEAHVR